MPLFGRRPQESATELFDRGGKELEAGRLKEAIHYYEKAIRADPKLARAWLNKGICLFDLGMQKEAESHFEKAIQIDASTRNDLKYFFSLRGNNLQKLGKLHEALGYFERALQVDPGDAYIWTQMGIVLWDLGKQEQAITCYKKAANISPEDVTIMHGIAGMLMTGGKYTEAVSYFEKVIEIDPRNKEAWWGKGICLSSLNRFQESLDCFDKALEIEPRDGEAWYLKSMVLCFLHRNKEEVRDCIRKALEFNPEYVIKRLNEMGLPEGFPLSPHDWLREILHLGEVVATKLAHTYHDLCVDSPDSGIVAIETQLKENPELESSPAIRYARAMAYMAKGFHKLQKRIETGEVDLSTAEPDELRPYLSDEDLKYLELALSEIRKIEDVDPRLIDQKGRAGYKVDAAAIALERCIPGRVQATLGKTKLWYFGAKRIKVMHSINEAGIKPLLQVFFKFGSIVRAALIMSQGRDDQGRQYIHCALFEKTFDVLGPHDTLEKMGWRGTIYLYDDGSFR